MITANGGAGGASPLRSRREIDADIAKLRLADGLFEREECSRCGAATEKAVLRLCLENVPDPDRNGMRWCGQMDSYDREGFCVVETERYLQLQAERDMAGGDEDDELEDRQLQEERLVNLLAQIALVVLVLAGLSYLWREEIQHLLTSPHFWHGFRIFFGAR